MQKIIYGIFFLLDLIIYPFYFLISFSSWDNYFGLRDFYKLNCEVLRIKLERTEEYRKKLVKEQEVLELRAKAFELEASKELEENG